MAFSPDRRLLAGADHDGTVRLRDPAAGKHRRTLTGHRGTVSRDARPLADRGDQDGPRTRGNADDRAPVNGVAFSPEGRLLANCGDDGMVRLRNIIAADR